MFGKNLDREAVESPVMGAYIDRMSVMEASTRMKDFYFGVRHACD